MRPKKSFVFLLIIAAVAVAAERRAAGVDYERQYSLPNGRVFGYVLLMQSRVGDKVEYLGGTVIFRSQGKSTETLSGERHVVGNRLSVIDNLRVDPAAPESLIIPRLPTTNRFLPESIVVNTVHGVRPKPDGDLPRMLGDTLEWFFPPIPFNESGTYHKEGYINRSRNVRIPSYFHYDSALKPLSDDLFVIKDARSLKSNDGDSIDVQGKSVIQFDKSVQLMTRRTMHGVHHVLGKTTLIRIDVRLLSAQEMKQLANGSG